MKLSSIRSQEERRKALRWQFRVDKSAPVHCNGNWHRGFVSLRKKDEHTVIHVKPVINELLVNRYFILFQ